MSKSDEKQLTVYRFGHFEVNPKEQLLRRDGEIVPLTPKIFETLLLLVQNNNRMLSKDEIMENVWADSFVEETNLTSNISRLRKILQAGGEQFIETFPKRGYRFCGKVEELTGETEIILKRRVTKYVRRIVEEFDDADALPEYAAALETLPNNLTLPNTPIVGREKEIAEVENLILHNRLVTLTGVGGTGKTRLSQEVACRMLSEFADGVFFIALADVRNAELVVSEIAQNLAVKESSGKTLVDALKDFLGEKELLLVADNFEQILPAAGILAELLAAAPDLKILATSRALLHLKAEREFNVPPLTLPLCSELHTMGNGSKFAFESFSENESIKLFTERARSAKTNFSLTEGNAATVAEICHKLDGLPLAIELAAARIKILSPSQILERLANRLKLLTGGAKNLPERQQTMRGAIEWSYDLLDKSERVLFGRLAVFAGDFTIEAVESVGNFPMFVLKSLPDGDERQTTEDGRLTIDVLNGITTLVENNLVVQTETANGESRFRLLEIIREYALETLEANGEGDLIKQRHAAFYLAFAKEAESKLYGEQTTKWLNRLEEEHDNLRAVISWSVINNVDIAINLVGAVRRFWILHNHLTEGRQWLEMALERSDNASGEVRFKLKHGIAQAALYRGDDETARKIFEENLAMGKTANDLRQVALSYRGLGGVSKAQGKIPEARKYIEEGLKISREAEDKFGIAVSLNNLGDLARMENDFAAACPLLEEALLLSRQLKNKEGICGSLNNLGAAAYGEGDYQAVRSYYAEAVLIALELGDKISVSYSLDGFAALASKGENFVVAARLAGAAEHLRESLGFETEPAERRFRAAYLDELRAAFDEEKFSAAYRQGSEMNVEKAVSLALGEER